MHSKEPCRGSDQESEGILSPDGNPGQIGLLGAAQVHERLKGPDPAEASCALGSDEPHVGQQPFSREILPRPILGRLESRDHVSRPIGHVLERMHRTWFGNHFRSGSGDSFFVIDDEADLSVDDPKDFAHVRVDVRNVDGATSRLHEVVPLTPTRRSSAASRAARLSAGPSADGGADARCDPRAAGSCGAGCVVPGSSDPAAPHGLPCAPVPASDSRSADSRRRLAPHRASTSPDAALGQPEADARTGSSWR